MLSTYNGAKYIGKQIDSILKQENVEVTLVIRDDGSTDETKSILYRFLKKYSNIVLINDMEHLGAAKSFFRILQYVYNNYHDTNFYSFADQDDIWLSRKTSIGIEKIKSFQSAIIYCSNKTFIDENDNILSINFDYKIHTFRSQFFRNHMSGCTLIFNKYLLDKIFEIGLPTDEIINYRLHDGWIMLLASAYGSIYYDDCSYIKYRIHNDNAVGLLGYQKHSVFKKVRSFFCVNNSKGYYSRQAKYLKKHFIGLKNEYYQFIELICNYSDRIECKVALMLHLKEISYYLCSSTYETFIKILLNYI